MMVLRSLPVSGSRRRAISRLITIACGAVIAPACAGLLGCSSGPVVSEKPARIPWPEERPGDFALVLIVLTPPISARELVTWPRALRSARYHLEPGGVLRASPTASSTRGPLPPIAREINADQADKAWSLVRTSGALDSPEARAGAMPTLEARDLRSRVSVASIECIADGRRRVLQLELDRATTEAIGVERLLEHLADLAWVRP
jgi:hypothetical protein